MNPPRSVTGMIAFGLLCVHMAAAHAFNTDTHEALNATAASAGGLHQYLQTEINFPSGVDTLFKDRPAVEWIRKGGFHEDDSSLMPPEMRFLHHFNDPLRPWVDAGLQLVPLAPRFTSSVVWMQTDGQGWSWTEARRFFFAALTDPSPAVRDGAWADTLRALGQIMHLVEDAAQPAHVRNDAHGMAAICRDLFHISCFGNFEYWVSDHPSGYSYVPDTPFDRALLYRDNGNHPEAPVPVAFLIDSDSYFGNDPSVTTGPMIGIGEFANANFFSEDTIHSPDYDFPDVSNLVPVDEVAPDGTIQRYYRKADGDGVPVYPVARGSVLDDTLTALGLPRLLSVDDRVWEATAREVIPRATDYAQGVLDYFFRGRLDLDSDPTDATRVLVTNLGSEDMVGTFGLYYDDTAGNRHVLPGGSSGPFAVAAGHQVSLPAFNGHFMPPPDGSYTVVFTGSLGGEPAGADGIGAVAVKVASLGSGYLVVDDFVGYRSVLLDRGWQRVGMNLGPPGLGYKGKGTYVDTNLLFLDPFRRSDDGGRTFRDISADLGPAVGNGTEVTSITYLGGADVLVSFFKPWCAWDFDVGHYACAPTGIARSSNRGADWVALSLSEEVAIWGINYIGEGMLLGRCTTLHGLSDENIPQYMWCTSPDYGLTWSPTVFTVDGVPTQPYVIDSVTGATDAGVPFMIHGCGHWGYGGGFAWNQLDGAERVILAAGWFGTWGSETHGVFRSTNGTDWESVLNVYASAVGVGPDGSALAGYHEPSGTPRLSKSMDTGQTWEPADAPSQLDGHGCWAIVPLWNKVQQ